MALEPSIRTECRVAGAALGALMIGGLAAGTAAIPARAQTASAPEQEQVLPTITRSECLHILGTASKVIGNYEGTLPPVYTDGWTAFFAKPKVDAKTGQAIDTSRDVKKILLNGTWENFSHPDTPDKLKYSLGVLKGVNCDGSRIIPTPDGDANIATFSIGRLLVASEDQPVILAQKGLQFPKPGTPVASLKVTFNELGAKAPVSSRPGMPKTGAAPVLAPTK
jgi:hypothetical protein